MSKVEKKKFHSDHFVENEKDGNYLMHRLENMLDAVELENMVDGVELENMVDDVELENMLDAVELENMLDAVELTSINPTFF